VIWHVLYLLGALVLLYNLIWPGVPRECPQCADGPSGCQEECCNESYLGVNYGLIMQGSSSSR
jgi:hypothetical protein